MITDKIRGEWITGSLLLLDVYDEVATVRHEHHRRAIRRPIHYGSEGFYIDMPEGSYYFIDCLFYERKAIKLLEGRACKKCGDWIHTRICEPCRKKGMVEYNKDNPEIGRVAQQRRYARKKALPDTLTKEEWVAILNDFGGGCALTRETENVQMEHFVALSTGHGGTVVGNIYPLCRRLNSSKNDKNPFEWSLRLSRKERTLFDEVVSYLADKNGMTVGQFTDYVYRCYNVGSEVNAIGNGKEAEEEYEHGVGPEGAD